MSAIVRVTPTHVTVIGTPYSRDALRYARTVVGDEPLRRVLPRSVDNETGLTLWAYPRVEAHPLEVSS